MPQPAHDHVGAFGLPLPSTAQRDVALSSKSHFCGHVVIGDGSGRGAVAGAPPRVVQVESHLELCWCLCLSVRADIADLREQMQFDWFDEDGEVHSHYFCQRRSKIGPLGGAKLGHFGFSRDAGDGRRPVSRALHIACG